MATDSEKSDFVRRVESVYNATLKGNLETHHSGRLIALEPDTGDYVLADRFRELELAAFDRFGTKPTHMFRVGGGGAVSIGGSSARVS